MTDNSTNPQNSNPDEPTEAAASTDAYYEDMTEGRPGDWKSECKLSLSDPGTRAMAYQLIEEMGGITRRSVKQNKVMTYEDLKRTEEARQAQYADETPAANGTKYISPKGNTMSILDNVEDKRHFAVPEGKEFILNCPDMPAAERIIRTLDDLSEAINLIDPDTFENHVDGDRNDFAQWVEDVFGEDVLAEQLRRYPTPLRMMVTIERFLR